MKILTTRIQREIERNRDIIYQYIRDNSTENIAELEKAVEALANISCDCGIWSNPFSFGSKIVEVKL